MMLDAAPLGKKSSYISTYTPELLFPIPRLGKREEISVPEVLPFHGVDVWMAYEVSWLNEQGKPEVAIAKFTIGCDSKNIIESKSFKLYLNSFNSSHFASADKVRELLQQDISQAAQGSVCVVLSPVQAIEGQAIQGLRGTCLDDLKVTCDIYTVSPQLIQVASKNVVEETVHSHLLKSNCLVTGQPDWGSVEICYKGPRLCPEGLLKYIISFRNHNEFHEQCVERIFMDITRQAKPESLTVHARYTRRGGLDINPYRSTHPDVPEGLAMRLARQ